MRYVVLLVAAVCGASALYGYGAVAYAQPQNPGPGAIGPDPASTSSGTDDETDEETDRRPAASWDELLWPRSSQAAERMDELTFVVRQIKEHNPPRGWEWLAFATVAAGAQNSGAQNSGAQNSGAQNSGAQTRELDTRLTVGGEVALAGRQCRLLTIGAQGVFAISGDERSASLEQWIRACPWQGIAGEDGARAIALRLYNELALGVESTLGARHVIAGGSYSSETFGFDTVGLEIPYHRGTRRLGLIGATMRSGWIWHSLGSGRNAAYQTALELWLVRLERLRPRADSLGHRVIDILVLDVRGNRDTSGASVVEAVPVRLRGMSLGLPYLRWDLAVGGAVNADLSVEMSVFDQAVSDEMITNDGLPAIAVGFARGSLYGGTESRHLGLLYDRRLAPTAASELILEDRLSAWWRWTGDRGQFDIRAFMARARVWGNRAAVPDAVNTANTSFDDSFNTSGAIARFDYTASAQLSIGIDAEFGRSLYRPDSAQLEVQPYARTMATVTMRRFGVRASGK